MFGLYSDFHLIDKKTLPYQQLNFSGNLVRAFSVKHTQLVAAS